MRKKLAKKVKRTWIEKRDCDKSLKIKTIDKKFADIPEGSKMFIATPQIIDEYVKHIPFGKSTELSTMRNDLAIEYQADKTCPVTTGIFLRIVSEASFEELKAGNDIEEVTPFWRIVNPKSKLAEKLECGIDFIEKQRELEGIEK
ncbi:MAG: hypothetical protein VX280_04785 [Bacteroidota bacterium]|nr:hypothetical protein [Bacteroidota bacterium]